MLACRSGSGWMLSVSREQRGGSRLYPQANNFHRGGMSSIKSSLPISVWGQGQDDMSGRRLGSEPRTFEH